MTALTKDLKTSTQFDDKADPDLIWFGAEANTSLYAGGICATDANGYAVPASASPGLIVQGRIERQVINTTAAGFGAANALQVQVRRGTFFYACPDSTITLVNVGQYCYIVDDNNVSLSDAGGTRPIAGVIRKIGTTGPELGKVAVALGYASPYGSSLSSGSSAAYKARAVVTSLSGAYTGSGTGVITASANAAFGAQDGVSTLAVGDVVLLPAGTTNISAAKDAGPWQITNLGSGSVAWVLTRPDWWATASTLPLAASVELDGEGTLFGGTTWRSFAAKGQVVDTNDPVLYPRQVTQSVALVSSAKTITNVPVYSATRSNIVCSLSAVGGTTTNTVGYGTIVTATPGAIGTATFTVNALAAGMTKNGTSDTSTILVTVFNG